RRRKVVSLKASQKILFFSFSKPTRAERVARHVIGQVAVTPRLNGSIDPRSASEKMLPMLPA
ncbi:MAG: hypothetical protein VX146_00160, partial [Pseudomonadota bacterium]|nr:hypothetical protein [Pseudomonadota bacterium]